MSALRKRAAEVRAYRISPRDTNYFALLVDPREDGGNVVSAVEIFAPGGKTPPNTHVSAHEYFFVLKGTGRAFCSGKSVDICQGDALIVPPGAEHVIENTGTGKLYTLTTMVPDEGFADLIRNGTPVVLDAEDLAVVCG